MGIPEIEGKQRMKSKISKVFSIIQRDGIGVFLSKFAKFCQGKLSSFLRRTHFRLFGNSTITIKVKGKTIEIDTKGYEQHARAKELGPPHSSERHVLETILEDIRDGDVFFDVGANIGLFSSIVGVTKPNTDIIAFEPYPPNVECIKTNQDLNSVEYDVKPIALSDTGGSGSLQILKTTIAGGQEHSLEEVGYQQNSVLEKDKVEVEKRAGDKLIKEGKLPVPNVVKIDVEGAGPNVIRGMSKSLSSKKCHAIVVEPHGNSEEILNCLEGLAFDVSSIENPNGEPYLYGRNSNQ